MELFNCPSCGAALEPDHDQDGFVECPFCGSRVIIPEELRRGAARGGEETRVVIDLRGMDERQPAEDNEGPSPQTKKRINSPGWITCVVILIFAAIAIPVVGAIAVPLAGQVALTHLFEQWVDQDNASQPVSDGGTGNVDIPALEKILPLDASGDAFASPVLSFGQVGSGAGHFDDTRWVGVDGQGNIYSAEYQDGRIQKFDRQGKFLLGWNVGDGKVVTDLAVSREGIVYVVHGGIITRYDSQDGSVMGVVDDPEGRYFDTVEIGVDNNLVTVSGGEDVVRFDANGATTLSIPAAVSSVSGDAELASRAAVDGLGNIYVLGQFNNAVFVYSREGKFSNRFGSAGDGPGQLRAPNDVAVDGAGRVYVSDIYGVEVFSKEGQYVDRIAVDGVGFGLAFNDEDLLLLASNSDKIIQYQLQK